MTTERQRPINKSTKIKESRSIYIKNYIVYLHLLILLRVVIEKCTSMSFLYNIYMNSFHKLIHMNYQLISDPILYKCCINNIESNIFRNINKIITYESVFHAPIYLLPSK